MPIRKYLIILATGSLYACVLLQFIRFYVVSTYFYLNMPRYLSGRERLPFQERILPIFLMWPINHSAFIMSHLAHDKAGVFTPSAATPQTIGFYTLSLFAFTIASILAYLLYRAVTHAGVLSVLIFLIFTVLTLWTYVVHVDANFSFPYDMPSLAFFTGGVLAIYTRHFMPLLLIMFFGTMNRETTLFLIGIYILDSASRDIPYSAVEKIHLTLAERFSFRQVSWLRVVLLGAFWLAVKYTIYYHFRFNDNSENYVRLWGNLGRLQPRLWPTLFNISGYMLPVVLVLRNRLPQRRFANYFYIFPAWAVVMLYTGVILEARIWGELCSITAVAAVLLLEDHVERQWRLRSENVQSSLPDAASRQVA